MAKETPAIRYFYAVAVTDGWIVDSRGGYIRDAVRFDCGHLHRTREAAERCQDKLRGYDPKARAESAKWYNSEILRVDSRGHHAPSTQAELEAEYPGFCGECNASVPGQIGLTLCPKCEAKFAAK